MTNGSTAVADAPTRKPQQQLQQHPSITTTPLISNLDHHKQQHHDAAKAVPHLELSPTTTTTTTSSSTTSSSSGSGSRFFANNTIVKSVLLPPEERMSLMTMKKGDTNGTQNGMTSSSRRDAKRHSSSDDRKTLVQQQHNDSPSKNNHQADNNNRSRTPMFSSDTEEPIIMSPNAFANAMHDVQILQAKDGEQDKAGGRDMARLVHGTTTNRNRMVPSNNQSNKKKTSLSYCYWKNVADWDTSYMTSCMTRSLIMSSSHSSSTDIMMTTSLSQLFRFILGDIVRQLLLMATNNNNGPFFQRRGYYSLLPRILRILWHGGPSSSSSMTTTTSTTTGNCNNNNNSNHHLLSSFSFLSQQQQLQLPSRPPAVVHGIPNYGQTCFLNVILQSFASLDAVMAYAEWIAMEQRERQYHHQYNYYNDDDDDDNDKKNKRRHHRPTSTTPTSTVSELLVPILLSLNGQNSNNNNNRTIDPRELLWRIAQKNTQFQSNRHFSSLFGGIASSSMATATATGEQQDAQELLQALLEMMIVDAHLESSYTVRTTKKKNPQYHHYRNNNSDDNNNNKQATAWAVGGPNGSSHHHDNHNEDHQDPNHHQRQQLHQSGDLLSDYLGAEEKKDDGFDILLLGGSSSNEDDEILTVLSDRWSPRNSSCNSACSSTAASDDDDDGDNNNNNNRNSTNQGGNDHERVGTGTWTPNNKNDDAAAWDHVRMVDATGMVSSYNKNATRTTTNRDNSHGCTATTAMPSSHESSLASSFLSTTSTVVTSPSACSREQRQRRQHQTPGGPALSASMQIMLSTISSITKTPLSCWTGSLVQCQSCRHVKAVRNQEWRDIPIVPTAVSAPMMMMATARSRGMEPPSKTHGFVPPPCTLEECLHQFTQVEPVEDVECGNCTLQRQIGQWKEEVDLLRGAAESWERKRQQQQQLGGGGGGPGSQLNALCLELEDAELKLRQLQQQDPDEYDPCDNKDSGGSSSMVVGGDDAGPVKMARARALKCLVLTRLPSVLCLHVQRRCYDPVTNRMSKTMQHVEFKEILDLAPFCAFGGNANAMKFFNCRNRSRVVRENNNPKQQHSPILYRLTSVVEHKGNAFGGHYVCYRRLPTHLSSRNDSSSPGGSKSQAWFYCSDEAIHEIPWATVRRAQAYMLFYEAI